MTRRRMWFLITAIVIVVVVIILTIIILAPSDTGMRVREVGPGIREVRDFENSRLRLHDNGTFEIEIVLYEDTRIFSGIGTWTRTGNTYEFYFFVAHTDRDGMNAPDPEYNSKKVPVTVGRNGWLLFHDHMGFPYHFG